MRGPRQRLNSDRRVVGKEPGLTCILSRGEVRVATAYIVCLIGLISLLFVRVGRQLFASDIISIGGFAADSG
jgi:hypothetical protein